MKPTLQQIKDRLLANPGEFDTSEDLVLYYEKKAIELSAFLYFDPDFDVNHYRVIRDEISLNFLDELNKFYGIPAYSEIGESLKKKAWDLGNSIGFREVSFYYEELVEIVNLAVLSGEEIEEYRNS